VPRFENQSVLVTGSGRGIGSAIAHRFAQEGARIQLVARSMDELEQTRSELTPLASEVRAMTLDLVLPGSARQLVDEVARGGSDWTFLSLTLGPPPREDSWSWRTMPGPPDLASRCSRTFVMKHAWPLLKASAGHLVMIGGGTARTPERQLSLVSAVNGGLASLSKSIAEQGIIDGIHVNLVQPGMVRTSRRQKLFEKWSSQEGIAVDGYIERTIRQLRVVRLGEPSDVTEVVAFLCSDQSRWMQGSIVDVDGGQNKSV